MESIFHNIPWYGVQNIFHQISGRLCDIPGTD